MQNRRYVLVIMTSTGATVRRLIVTRRIVELVIATGAMVVLAAIALFVHSLVLLSPSEETRRIQQENAELTRIVAQLERRLPQAREMALHIDLNFAQLWSKSGLGLEPKLLGLGPVEANDMDELAPGGAVADASRDVLDLEPPAIPAQFDRIEGEGKVLQTTLAETLEYFYDAERLLSNTPSVRPVRGAYLTSSFGRRRDPIFGHWVMHKGLDMGGRIGTEIMAPADGIVIWTGTRGGYGKTVVIDHGYGLQTHFAHLSRFLVQYGDHVKRGDPVAEMGSTGKSTGPHLHYEVRRFGRPMDPRRFILD